MRCELAVDFVVGPVDTLLPITFENFSTIILTVESVNKKHYAS